MAKNIFLRKATSLGLALIMILSVLSLTACPQPTDELEPMLDPTDDNYRTFYQIFVGSFSDSNNDGIGDLRGIINRFDYLNDGDINNGNDLGVQGIWLSPIFTSPTYHKYDAKDYYQIDWRFGTEADLVELIELCNERNVKLILDLAINHTAKTHPWFQEFEAARKAGDVDNKYYNFYSCTTTAGQKNGIQYGKIAGIDCWYECNFSGDMPELNYDNPDVREAMLDVARYYLDLGVHGFRFDAIKYIYYGDTAKSASFWEWYMGELRKDYPDMYAVGECWSGETEILKYYDAMNCFNFAMSSGEGQAAKAAKGTSNIFNFTKYVENYQKKVTAANPDGMCISFLSNHDQDRIAGTFVTDNYMKMAASLYLLSPGSPVIYYGEEIGLRGSRGDANTDANRRLAMRWGDSDLVKDPLGSTYPAKHQITSTVLSQLEDENSILSHYSKVINIRNRYPEIARGTYTAFSTSNKNLGGFVIEYEGAKTILIHNTSANEISYDLSTISNFTGLSYSEICEIVGVGTATLNGSNLVIGPHTSILIK